MKVYLDMVGCRLNQSEIETFAQQFEAKGHTLTGDPTEADLAVVNTCTVTVAAAADSRKKIRRFARKGAKEIVATGCWATLEPVEAKNLTGVSAVIPNSDKDNLVSEVLNLEPEVFDQEPLEREMIPGARLRTRAFIKAQDGCDHRCTFCITTIARGKSKSISIPDIMEQVRAAGRGGAKEVVLTGVQLGSWGHELPDDLRLHHVLRAILTETEIPRIRLSSIEPWDVERPLIEIISEERVARQLHLPLQSGSADTLKRMARMITPGEYADLVDRIRGIDPDIAITTDILVGFPGESEKTFSESLAFVEDMAFADAHIFTFSKRKGTTAARMPDQVDHQVRKERHQRMQEVVTASSRAYRAAFIDQEMDVLWESVSGLGDQRWRMSGLTDNYIRVEAEADKNLWNQITPVRLRSLSERGMKGIVES